MYDALRRLKPLKRWARRLPSPLIAGWYRARARLLPGYSAAAPSRVLWVDPRAIRGMEGPGGQWRIGVVMDGDWDLNPRPLSEDRRYAAALALLRGEPLDADAAALAERTLRKLDAVAAQIRRHGYLCQRDLLRLDRRAAVRGTHDTVHPLFNEVGVTIYRDGTMVRAGSGFHRLLAARALGVPRLPVIVRVRHARWEALREAVRRARRPEDLPPEARAHLDHPDLQDVLPREGRPRGAIVPAIFAARRGPLRRGPVDCRLPGRDAPPASLRR